MVKHISSYCNSQGSLIAQTNIIDIHPIEPIECS